MATSDLFEDLLDMIPEGTQATEHTRSTSFDENVTYSTGYPDVYDLSGDVQEFSHFEGFITAQLRRKFEGGLQSTSAPYHKQISDVAAQLNISVKVQTRSMSMKTEGRPIYFLLKLDWRGIKYLVHLSPELQFEILCNDHYTRQQRIY